MLNNSVRPIKSLVNLLGHTFSQFNSNKDYFKILGVKSTATDMEIKTAFYALAKKYHPDHSKGF
jgi:preprotein translocase subunit Sec63